MTPAPHTIGRDQSLTSAHHMMREHRIRHLPVLSGGRVVGLLSERDLALIETLHSVDPDLTIAEEAMTQAPYTVTPDTPLDEVVATMAGQRYGSALVMEHERIVGVFTTTDALEALVELLRPHPGRA
ncbi:MAG: CBS domain-containing protein [Deltaproteobacteria bacterium]|jgi:acetoin utilization protein AcuB|nr:CBS domain-containing protein [Deltaproteobacteria bacterium]MBK8695103.1 CBS domain-containing protein [Deltaproteobacteria bacterium]MBP6832795.1 CBS domain-containing protein [Deltaproteobacteria bacterium]